MGFRRSVGKQRKKASGREAAGGDRLLTIRQNHGVKKKRESGKVRSTDE